MDSASQDSRPRTNSRTHGPDTVINAEGTTFAHKVHDPRSRFMQKVHDPQSTVRDSQPGLRYQPVLSGT